MKITAGADLSRRNTLALPGRCRQLIEIENNNDFNKLPEIIDANYPVYVLGRGSNTVLVDETLPHTIISCAPPPQLVAGIDHEGDTCWLAAGLDWPQVVQWSVGAGLGGIENLAAIPGSCGAAPVQNIGAYGVELSDVLQAVEVFDWQKGVFFRLGAGQCGFGYRDSIFKREPDRPWIISRIGLRLRRDAPLRLHYAGVSDALLRQGIELSQASHAQVAQVITAIRASKLPDPAQTPNAGSFFKNPLVKTEQLTELLQEFPALPHWPQADGRHKLSAAWLIERLGLNRLRVGDAGFYTRHALILINQGAATGGQVMALANQVIVAVASATGIVLEPEPVRLGGKTA